jgi:hypothetical protein
MMIHPRQSQDRLSLTLRVVICCIDRFFLVMFYDVACQVS